MTITKSIKFDKLQAKNEALKKELAEKDKYIKNLENNWESVVYNNYNLQQTQLYKEDLEEIKWCNWHDNCWHNCDCFSNSGYKRTAYVLKDNSKYDKLPSKDVK